MGGLISRPLSTRAVETKFIENTIKENCIVVFAKSECFYSQMAKEVFDTMKVPYKAVDLDLRPDGEQIQEILGRQTDASTVPRVFVNGTCIGGAMETKDLHESGKLHDLVLKCSLSTLCKQFCPLSTTSQRCRKDDRLSGDVVNRILLEN